MTKALDKKIDYGHGVKYLVMPAREKDRLSISVESKEKDGNLDVGREAWSRNQNP